MLHAFQFTRGLCTKQVGNPSLVDMVDLMAKLAPDNEILIQNRDGFPSIGTPAGEVMPIEKLVLMTHVFVAVLYDEVVDVTPYRHRAIAAFDRTYYDVVALQRLDQTHIVYPHDSCEPAGCIRYIRVF